MPEGDTIHRTAARLRAVLVGRRLTRVELARGHEPTGGRTPAAGAAVTAVEARGKHLLIHVDDGLVIHTHQGMTGSWHCYPPGQRWQRSRRAARVVLAVPGTVAVCFASPVVEVLAVDALDRHPVLRRLGPDLCSPDADLDAALARLRALPAPATPVGEALLDQRIACGVGNIYRCDVLFLHGIHPRTPVGALSSATQRRLLASAAELLQANLTTRRRTTVPGTPGARWVHGRTARPCRRCSTPIAEGHLGDPPRVIHWCPTCQPAPGGDATSTRRRRGLPARGVAE